MLVRQKTSSLNPATSYHNLDPNNFHSDSLSGSGKNPVCKSTKVPISPQHKLHVLVCSCQLAVNVVTCSLLLDWETNWLHIARPVGSIAIYI